MESLEHNPSPKAPVAGVALAVGSAVLFLVIDLNTPRNLYVPILYNLSVILAYWARSRRFVWSLAGALVLLNYVGHPLSPDTWGFPHPLLPWMNRTLVALSILITAAVVHHLVVRHREILAHQAELQQRNDELSETNEELAAREEEIARQNEELQSQTEELERQSEELRVANEELLRREKLLAALLDLSRSLTAELTQDQVMSRVCESLNHLLGGTASAAAILERRDDHVVVSCHYGFGKGGPDRQEMSFGGTLASLVMSQGQAGYLEDLSLRPDVHIPQPKSGERFHSVLAAPLRVHGRAVGSLEVYGRERRNWTAEQIALLESLAAQTSISLETARLFEEIDWERRRFKAVVRTLPIGVFVAEDAGCRNVRGNAAAAALYSAAADANFSPLAPPEERVQRTLYRNGRAVELTESPVCRATLRGEEIRGEEWEMVLPDGRRVVLLASAAPIYDADGNRAGGVCAFTDVTQLKQIERELDRRRREAEEASLRKSRFLAAVSHDVRTPANAISLLAELLQRSVTNPAMASEIPAMAQDLRASAASLVELVTDVLDLTRFDSGKIELQETEFMLRDAIAEECRQMQPVAAAKGLKLECGALPDGLRVRTDRVKLGRVVGNLLGNAIKFTDEGQVRVEAELMPDRQLQVRVSDTGVGIAPEHQERIFDEFFQLRNPERNRAKGMGLGLTICKRLVDAMGGQLQVHSEPGDGSTFVLTLPPSVLVPGALAADSTPSPPASGAGELRGKRVLLVEDHASSRKAIARLLAAQGAQVDEAGDAASALRLLGEVRPDVLLLDLMLPDRDGVEILRSLARTRPEQLRCVLVLTGDSSRERMEEVKALGADVLHKPVDMPELVRIVAKRCEGNGG